MMWSNLFDGTTRVQMKANRLLLLAAFFCLVNAGSVAAADNRKPGTVKMAATLQRIAAQANPMENPFLNRGRVAAMRAAMAANTNMGSSPEMQFRFGAELLNAGENENALAAFNRVESLGRSTGSWNTENEINVGLNKALCYLRMAEQ